MMMFEVPEAKRIKRSAFLAANSDGNSSDGSGQSSRQVSPAHAEGHQVEIDYGFEYDFVSPPQPAQKSVVESGLVAEEEQKGEENDDEKGQENEEATYQFRLFNQTQTNSSSSPLSKALQVQQAIRLSSTPEPESFSIETARFVRPRRPESYHFTSALPEATQALRKSQYEDVAVSTREVLLSASTTKWPGTALPWRVINISLNTTTTTTTTTKSPPSSTSRPKRGPMQTEPSGSSSQGPSTRKLQPRTLPRPRPRPSKSRRILLRRQLAAKAEASQRQILTDAAEREKRTRRNREKKVKRKEREKLKKVTLAPAPGSAADADAAAAAAAAVVSNTGDATVAADSD